MDVATTVVAVTVAVVVGGIVGFVVVRLAAVHAVAEQRDELRRVVDTLSVAAGEQLQAHTRAGTAHLDTRNELIGAELDRMGRTLGEVTTLVHRLESERSTQFGQVREQLEGVASQHRELTRTTGALREALSASQTRGQWGERMAADVLRAAGFVEGVNYRTQVTTRSGTRPDITFLLPDDQVVHMDVKFPLGRYLSMLEAESDTERDTERRAFLRAVRDRVKELDGRGYIDAEDGTLDCVLLFIPNEQVYGFVHEHDPALLDDALARKVVLCSPTTLFAVLAVIRQTVESFALERTSDEILQLLGGFAKQWGAFTDGLDKLGRGLDTTQRAYDALSTTRRTQLERQLERVEELRSRRGIEAALAEDRSARLVPLHTGSAEQGEVTPSNTHDSPDPSERDSDRSGGHGAGATG
jgi:DNA recombination protein RmuC